MHIDNVLACDRFYVIKETILHTHGVKGGTSNGVYAHLGVIKSNIQISVRELVLFDPAQIRGTSAGRTSAD